MTLKRYVRVEKIKGILQESLPAFLDMLRMEGFTNGCELCGEMKETGAAYVAGNAICLCDECLRQGNPECGGLHCQREE